MDRQEAQYAALAGLVHVMEGFDPAFGERIPFPLPKMEDVVSRAGSLATGGESLDEAEKARLRSIFSLLKIHEQTAPPFGEIFIPIKPLSLDIDTDLKPLIFPVNEERSEIGRKERWTAISDGMKALKSAHSDQDDIETYLESLMYLMQRELWGMPSGLQGASLFDHARATAALTVCLAGQGSESYIATLIGGDISGIQNFIYTITSKGAASALRGRSLYLQLLTDAIARFILRELNLPVTNLLFAGGGHFFILARPNPDLNTLRKKISRILLSLHGGELYLALEGVSLNANDFTGKALSGIWRELSGQLREAKLHKFSELQNELYLLVFQPRRDQGNQEKECIVCGREHPGTEEKNGRRICPQCYSYEELGKDLREASYLRMRQIKERLLEENDPPGDVETALACFGLRATLYDSLREMTDGSKPLDGVTRSVVHAFRDDALKGAMNERHTAVGRRFIVNVTPAIKDDDERTRLRESGVQEKDLPQAGDVKPFKALEVEGEGIKRLGILRMDVDNMGAIISEGLGEKANLARIANLSFMINLFFEGWAAERARQYNREGGAKTDSVYSIYSGGDDLFFVGAWDRMPKMALEIRNDLMKFVCHHPGVHASAGIALVGGKYPLYQAAEDAHNALEKSKGLERTGDRDGKNAITFLNQTIPWELFADEVKPHADTLKDLVNKGSIPRSMIQRLQQFQIKFQEKQEEARLRGEAETNQGDEQVVWGPWNWHAAYFLARARVKEDAKKEVEKLRNKLGDEQFRAIEWIGLSARWVDLLTR